MKYLSKTYLQLKYYKFKEQKKSWVFYYSFSTLQSDSNNSEVIFNSCLIKPYSLKTVGLPGSDRRVARVRNRTWLRNTIVLNYTSEDMVEGKRRGGGRMQFPDTINEEKSYSKKREAQDRIWHGKLIMVKMYWR